MIDNFGLRLFLFSGLLLHKAVWEFLKRGEHAAPKRPASLSVRLIKGVKIAILLGICAQTMLPEMLPISASAADLRTVGVALYVVGLATAIMGRVQLGRNWLDIETAGVRRDQAVVAAGLYRFIRHPIYTGDLLLLAGLELALNSWLVLGVIALIPVVARQAVREEAMLARSLSGYEEYRERTKRFIPFVV